MSTVVVKLGSSIVADERGEVRTEVLAALCDEVAARHADGEETIVVTSGAIARGMRLMELPMRPSGMEELQAASAVGQGKLYRHYDELLQERGVQVGAGPADVLRHVRAHALPQRPGTRCASCSTGTWSR